MAEKNRSAAAFSAYARLFPKMKGGPCDFYFIPRTAKPCFRCAVYAAIPGAKRAVFKL